MTSSASARYRILFLPPVLAAAGVLAAALVVTGADATARLYWSTGLAAKAVAVIGSALAAWRFSRGDYLRTAWALMGVSYALLVVKDAAFGVEGPALSDTAEWTRAGFVLASNAAGVVSTILFARAWGVAGLALPQSASSRVAVIAGAILIAAALAGPTTWSDVRAGIGGDSHSWGDAASDVGDMAALILIAPVLLTTLALRGGLLVWPWALLTASNLGWLLFDAAGTVGDLLHANPTGVTALGEGMRVLACTFVLSAGLAQRRVVGGD